MNQQIYEFLGAIARNSGLCTYSDVAPIVDLNLENDADRETLSGYLAEICQHEQQGGRPMLSALVIHSGGDNNPGNGFFELAEQMGRFNGTGGTMGRVIFWINEVKSVHDAWRN